MKFLVMLSLIFQFSNAHKGHDHELKAKEPPVGVSIYRLDSEWKNQNGESIKVSSLRGSPRMVVMLYTKCSTACPLIVEDLKSIVEDLGPKHAEKVRVALFSVDSVQETPKSLADFVVKRKLPSGWDLFASNANAVAELAAGLGVRYKRLQNGDYIHSNVIYFLNSEGEIIARKEGIKSPRKEFLAKVRKAL